MIRALVAALVLAAGCYDPSFNECTVRCASDGTCPMQTTCGDDGWCHADVTASCLPDLGGVGGGATGDGGTPLDLALAPPDAPLPDLAPLDGPVAALDQSAAPADLANATDLPPPADLAGPADLAQSMDLARPADLAQSLDLAKPTDLARPMDLLSDSTPPTFAGATGAIAQSNSSVRVTWNAASDNVTPQSSIIYYVYQSNLPGGESFGSPGYVTAAGAVSYLVTGLLPATTYYFVVRARDLVGNLDGNNVEVSARTPLN